MVILSFVRLEEEVMKSKRSNEVLEVNVQISLLNDAILVLTISDSIQKLLGFSPDDYLTGKISLKEQIHPDDLDIADILFSTKNLSSNVANIRLRQANGRIRCIKVISSKETTSNGVVLDMILQDSKSLQRTMWDSSEMINFTAIMENTDDYIYFKDRNHVFTGASQSLVSLCSPAEHWSDLLGLTDYDVFPTELADIYYRLEKQVFAGIPIAHEIQETLTNDGIHGWVDNRKYPIRDENGTLIGLYGIARDITQSKLQQIAQQEVLERLALATVHNGVGIWDWNLQTMELVWDDSMFALYHMRREDFSGAVDAWEKSLHPDDKEAFQEELRVALSGGKPLDTEFRVIWQNGEIHHIKAIAKTFFDDNGKVLRILGTNIDITQQKRLEEQVRRLAFYDELTSLPNRRLLNDRLTQTIAANKRSRSYGAIMFLDLDNFKPLNDTYGHVAGDLLLIEAANRLKNCMREMDTVARFGGDEFVVMLGELEVDRAKAILQTQLVAEKILAILAEPYSITTPFNSTIVHHCTASIGIVIFIEHKGSNDNILNWADNAMYRAKELGRNRIEFHDA